MSYSPIEFSALFGVPGVRVQIPPDTQNGLLASVVRLEKFEGVKSPETVDAVGVQPTASKLFGSFGAVGGIRTLGRLLTVTRFPVVLVMTSSIPLHI